MILIIAIFTVLFAAFVCACTIILSVRIKEAKNEILSAIAIAMDSDGIVSSTAKLKESRAPLDDAVQKNQ